MQTTQFMKAIVIVLSLISFPTFAQVPNLTGQWAGTSGTAFGTYQVFDQITQEGLTISGKGKIINLQQTDSSAYEFEGYVKGDNIVITHTKFIYKSPLACLSKVKLSYSKTNEGELLKGRWGSQLVKGGCLPGIGGKTELMKVEEPPAHALKAKEAEQTIGDNDFIGRSLAQRLQKTKYYALLIGIEDYQADGIAVLNQPVKDAESLYQTLSSKYGFNKQNTISLKNPTRAAIIESFESLSRTVSKDDQLLIFYAGHGVWDEKLAQGYWLPVDASMQSKSQWLSNSTIRDYLRAIESKHTLLITDACFSGGLLKERAVYNNSKAMLELYKLPSRKAITSGTLTTVPDNSIFMKYLIKNLENSQVPLLSASELFASFKIAVINNSPNGQVPQLGAISQSGDEGGEFIFLKK